MISWFWLSVILYIAGTIVYRDMLRLAALADPEAHNRVANPKTGPEKFAVALLMVVWPALVIWTFIGQKLFPGNK